jgi:nitroimidazol reductase NimA-like FMN-containing flavoprotein (pyridoxamine 5'-phosphate oxidase superfamily)
MQWILNVIQYFLFKNCSFIRVAFVLLQKNITTRKEAKKVKPYHGQIQELSPADTMSVLNRGYMGHLGSYYHGEVYVVPVTYTFEDGYIYSHSRPGKKIQMMQHNPEVCFQVEEVKDFYRWKSAIAWGTFEEIRGDQANIAMRNMIKKISPQFNQAVNSQLELDFAALLEASILFRIKIKKSTGRTEGYDLSQ